MLQIVVDATRVDKYRDQFVQALIRECTKQSVQHSLVYVKNNIESFHIERVPTVYVEPYSFVKMKAVPNADKHATANVVADAIKDMFEGTPNPNVLIINRSELIGKPLWNYLLAMDYAPMCAHSKTPTDKLYKMCSVADVVICATGHKIELPYHPGQVIIDVSADATDMQGKYNIEYVPMSVVGKATVKKIVERGR